MTWLACFVGGYIVISTGIDPIELTEYAVVLSVIALPLTYLPILLIANDHTYMGSKTNGKLANFFGVLYFIVIIAIALAAIPLMLITHGGQG